MTRKDADKRATFLSSRLLRTDVEYGCHASLTVEEMGFECDCILSRVNSTVFADGKRISLKRW